MKSRPVGGAAAGAAVALCVLLLTGTATADPRADDAPGGAASYRPAQGSVPITGTESSADGPRLERAKMYSDTIGPGQKKYYRVRLDDASHAFVSTVLAPPPGTGSGILDGIQVDLTSATGTPCGSSPAAYFGGDTTRPIASYASRRIKNDAGACQQAGDYLYTVTRVGSKTGGGAEWPIELTYMAEPGLKPGEADPQAPTSWSSEAPSPPDDSPQKVSGGTGFNDAAAVDEGTWRDDLQPGDNTARGPVSDKSIGYRGAPVGVDLGTAPAAYANRFGGETTAESAMRFQGWYYVQVTLDPKIPRSVPMTLNVTRKGEPQPGPPYDGDPEAAGFGIGDTGPGSGEDLTMRAIGFAGIGAGTVLVLGLGAWQLLSRRRRPAEGDAGVAYSR